MRAPLELRQLRYFVAVAEELHFGHAAERLHMSQSPLSRAIRELERQLGVDLLERTTRRVALTPAGEAFLDGARRALAAVDEAADDARRVAELDAHVVTLGNGPLCRHAASAVAEAVGRSHPGLRVLRDEDYSPELLTRVAARDLDAAVVLGSPRGGRRHRLAVLPLCDEPLMAALPAAHRLAGGPVPVDAFAAERVLVPRGATGHMYAEMLTTILATAGAELGPTLANAAAPWDPRLPRVAAGDAVAAVPAGWGDEALADVAVVPFDPPLTMPVDLVSAREPPPPLDLLLAVAVAARDAQGWLTTRRAAAA